jgi:hypothetical protein
MASDRVVPEKELIITDLKVVDSGLAQFPGPFSFGHLVTELAGDQEPGEFVLNWLGIWEKEQFVNTFRVPPRPAIREKVIESWQRSDGYDSESGERWKPNFENAPFRLLAIVNRLDIASSFRFVMRDGGCNVMPTRALDGRYGGSSSTDSILRRQDPEPRENQLLFRPLRGSAAEVRLVYGVIDENGEPLKPDFTVIFEYGLPLPELKEGQRGTLLGHAVRWHRLGGFRDFDSTYLETLANLTRMGTDRQSAVVAGLPNLNPPPLKHLRTNDGALGEGREFREFVLAENGNLEPDPLDNTPAAIFFDRESKLNRELGGIMQGSPVQIIETGFFIPAVISGNALGRNMFRVPGGKYGAPPDLAVLGGNAIIYGNDATACWSSPNLTDPMARHTISKDSCIGCHAGETATTDCVHIKSRRAGEPAELSAFLTDRTFSKFKDPIHPKVEHQLTELPERILLFQSLFEARSSEVLGRLEVRMNRMMKTRLER